uniref:Uncharacterized protein n=1 Tax=Anguilla anguilla TaxID=7936 RepID=A0A0E9XKD8_ANGAN
MQCTTVLETAGDVTVCFLGFFLGFLCHQLQLFSLDKPPVVSFFFKTFQTAVLYISSFCSFLLNEFFCSLSLPTFSCFSAFSLVFMVVHAF